QIAVALLLVLAVTLVVPRAGELFERPFAFLTRRRTGDLGGGFVLGASLGLVFVPCAGPVFGAVSGLAGLHRVGASAVFVTLAYALGAALPMLAIAHGSRRAVARLRAHAQTIRVVLVDFWTYSCINCLRTLSHLEAWDARYRKAGLAIVGIHTPEFAFEHDLGNVRGAVKRLGIRYPVGLDNAYSTWDAYQNQFWPAEYLIDARGRLRGAHFGEGRYGETEQEIRTLLAARGATLPPPTGIPDRTPTGLVTPETYLGYGHQLQTYVGTGVRPNRFFD